MPGLFLTCRQKLSTCCIFTRCSFFECQVCYQLINSTQPSLQLQCEKKRFDSCERIRANFCVVCFEVISCVPAFLPCREVLEPPLCVNSEIARVFGGSCVADFEVISWIICECCYISFHGGES